jgi:glycerol uptake facilitator protein
MKSSSIGGRVMAEHDELTVAEEGEAPLLRRLGAEFVGALLLVAVGAGAAVVLALGPLRGLQSITEQVPEGQPLDAFNNALFTQLLGNNLGDNLGVAIAFGFVLAVLIYALGGVSGAHFNPAVTFALALARRFSWTEVPLYWVAQILGGVAGALVIGGIYGESAVTFEGTDLLLGATVLGPDVTAAQAVLAEAVITFILMTAIMAIAVDPRAPKGWSGLVIGISLTAGILLTGAATGGSANFARSFGPLFVSWLPMYDAGSIPWGDLWIYALGPIVGAAAAALLYESITGLERFSPAPQPGAATPTGGALLGGVDDGVTTTDPHSGPGGGDDAPNTPQGPYSGPS